MGGPRGILLGFNPRFSLMLLNLERNRCRTRKRIKFWIERLTINWAEELRFRGTQFQYQSGSQKEIDANSN